MTVSTCENSPTTRLPDSSLERLLQEAERRKIPIPPELRLGATASTKSLWTPLPGPQAAAFYSEADELFYGGAAGGGKTELLLGLALTAHRSSIIFRREFPQLRDIIERSRTLTEGAADYNGSEHMIRLHEGRRVEFGAVQHEWDKQKYQGRAHDLKAYDELPQLTQSQYQFLSAWNRTVIPGQRCRIVATGNPPVPGQEGAWIIEAWAPWLDPTYAKPAAPGELRWFAMLDDELVWVDGPEAIEREGQPPVRPRSRTFIPARVEDNPFLMASGYDAVLESLPEPLRSQLRFGDFTAGSEDDPWQVIPTRWVQAAQARWEKTEQPDLPMTCLGVDVARGGKDQTVLSPRYGAWFAPLQKHAGRTTPDGPSVAALVLTAIASERAFQPGINMDSIGVGSSPVDLLQAHGLGVNPVNFASGSDATDRSGKYKLRNLRAEAYWKLREALDPNGGDDLALPPDRELLGDLCAPRWTLTAAGIGVEPKDDIAKRIGRSPDCGDAVALAHMPAAGVGAIRPVERRAAKQRVW